MKPLILGSKKEYNFSPSKKTMIYLQNLHKQFGSKIILKKANFHLRPGERVGLVGENGTGKTTLFRIIMKTESSDSGKVIFR